MYCLLCNLCPHAEISSTEISNGFIHESTSFKPALGLTSGLLLTFVPRKLPPLSSLPLLHVHGPVSLGVGEGRGFWLCQTLLAECGHSVWSITHKNKKLNQRRNETKGSYVLWAQRELRIGSLKLSKNPRTGGNMLGFVLFCLTYSEFLELSSVFIPQHFVLELRGGKIGR